MDWCYHTCRRRYEEMYWLCDEACWGEHAGALASESTRAFIVVWSWAWVRVPGSGQGLPAWFALPAGATGGSTRAFLPASPDGALLNTQGTSVEKTGHGLAAVSVPPRGSTHLCYPHVAFSTRRGLSSSHALPQAPQCLCAVFLGVLVFP